MRILTIGNSQSTKILTNCLSNVEENLVFTTAKDTEGNFIDINPNDVAEIVDFALANEINLSVVSDNTLFNIDYSTPFNENGLTLFAPDFEAVKIASSKSFGKKFIYKNKILTPRFSFFEKALPAIDYVRTSNFPLVIKPDCHSPSQTPYIAETFVGAKKYIEKLFQTDNKKVLLEDYVYGKEVTVYVISDGFNPVVIDFEATYLQEFAMKDPSFLNREVREKIYTKIILPTIANLNTEGTEYIGILGFDIIITPDGEPYLIEYNPFFKDMDTRMMLEGTDENWAKLFMGAITGTLTQEISGAFEIKKSEEFFGAIRCENEYVTESAKRMSALKTKLFEEGLNHSTWDEAQKIWKL